MKITLPNITPGDWKHEIPGPGVSEAPPYWIDSDGLRVADICHQSSNTEPNAQAISALPDLLAALAYAAEILESYRTTHVGVHHHCLETAQSALLKAGCTIQP